MEAVERQLKTLRDNLTRAQQAESLYVCNNCGRPSEAGDFLVSELNRVLDAFKLEGVNPKSLESQVQHAAVVGGHSAINSFLGIIESLPKTAATLKAKVVETEKANKEELGRINAA